LNVPRNTRRLRRGPVQQLPHRRRRARPGEDQHGQGHAEPMYWVLGAYAARKTKPRATSYCAGLHSAQTPAASRLLVVGTSLAALVAVSDRCQARETRALCRGTGTAERRDDSRPRRAAIFGTNRCDKSSSQALDGRFVPDYFRLAPTCARRRCGVSRSSPAASTRCVFGVPICHLSGASCDGPCRSLARRSGLGDAPVSSPFCS